MEHSTIAAIATAPGAGGIAVVRLSGPESYAVAAKVFCPANPAKRVEEAKGYTALFGHFMEGEEAFDEGVALFFRAPHSYTGEDVVELSCHGGSAVARRLVESCIAAGAAPAAPGEYTRRAFLNGKLGLTQAEAVMDLISADGRQGAVLANASLNGALAKKIGAEKDALTALQAHLTAWVDFPEEDVPALENAQLVSTLTAVKGELDTLIRNYDAGAVLREGVDCAIVGRPNAGKSTLLNLLAGFDRAIVTPVAGTTRDGVDSYFENDKGKYLFIDTAGMRKKSKVVDRVEKFSVLRATMAIDRADVCLIMIDANDGVTEQDTKVAGLAHEAGKACIIVVNKWDIVEKDDRTMDKMRQAVRADLSYMSYAPIVFISALTGQRVDRLFELINYVNDQATLRIKTGVLNSLLADATTRVQPPTDKGRRLKIYYMTQIGVRPPHFVVFCNDARLFHFSYQRYLENQIRSTFGMEGTPIRLTIRQKGDKEDD